MKFFGNAVVFVLLYVLFMLPTYFLPYLGSNSAVIGVLGVAADAGINPAFWAHLGSLVALMAVTWLRGLNTEKTWLLVFPLMAAVFDLTPALNNIPLIPTTMHLLAIILGVVGGKSAVRQVEQVEQVEQQA